MLTALVNGVEAETITVGDRGLQYGDGIFETLAVYSGKARNWARHVRRVEQGCERLGITPPDMRDVAREIGELAGTDERCVIKLIITRGVGERGYRASSSRIPARVVMKFNWPSFPPDADKIGVAVRWCETRLARQPRLAGIKHLNRLEQVLARAEWDDDHAEGLMCDTDGWVIEGTMSNLFVVTQGVVVTPDLSQSGVAGVVRTEILECAANLGITTKVQSVSREMVEQADELFITNSLINIWPVARLGTRKYVVGEVTKTLQAALSGTRQG